MLKTCRKQKFHSRQEILYASSVTTRVISIPEYWAGGLKVVHIIGCVFSLLAIITVNEVYNIFMYFGILLIYEVMKYILCFGTHGHYSEVVLFNEIMKYICFGTYLTWSL